MARPKKPEKDVRVSACGMFLPDIVAEIDRIAHQTRRSRSQVVEMFVRRGLAAFKRDGLLVEPDNLADYFEVLEEHPKPIKATSPKKIKA